MKLIYYIYNKIKDAIKNEIEKIIDLNINALNKKTVCLNCDTESKDGYLLIRERVKDKHTVFLFNGGWRKLEFKSGWSLNKSYYYILSIDFSIIENVNATIFCLFYNEQRDLIYKRALGKINSSEINFECGFASMGKSVFFNIAVYLPVQDNFRFVKIKKAVIKYKYIGYPDLKYISKNLGRFFNIFTLNHTIDRNNNQEKYSIDFNFSEYLANKRKELKRKKKYNKKQYYDLISPYLNQDYMVCTHSELVDINKNNKKAKVLLLRHDVDHDIETAVKMAQYESDLGIRSTYCILHTSWYYDIAERGEKRRDMLINCCKEIQNLGHEINFHNNLVTKSLDSGIDIEKYLTNELLFFQKHGIKIFGTSTHGDKKCNILKYRNFEIFSHSVKQDFGGVREINHKGNKVKLGTLSMNYFNLTYEAYDFYKDLYITDSGGFLRWKKNEVGRDVSHGVSKNTSVVGILTHPIWWDFD